MGNKPLHTPGPGEVIDVHTAFAVRSAAGAASVVEVKPEGEYPDNELLALVGTEDLPEGISLFGIERDGRVLRLGHFPGGAHSPEASR